MTWGYVYRTTDGQLYIQQDQNSRGQVSVGAGVGSVSVGYTPPAATKAELLTDIKQFPPNRTVQPGRRRAATSRRAGNSCRSSRAQT
jgi:hypothetical protein